MWQEIGKHKVINLETAAEQYRELGYPHRNILHLRCPECGKVTLVDESITYKFCPHCGFDMDNNLVDVLNAVVEGVRK